MMKTQKKTSVFFKLSWAATLFTVVTPLTTHASGSYVSPNALLKKKPAAEPAPTPTPEAKKKK